MISISRHWSDSILCSHTGEEKYCDELYQHILSDIPFGQNSKPQEQLLNEFYDQEQGFDKYKRLATEHIDMYLQEVYEIDDLPYHVKTFLVTNGIYSHTPFHNHRGAFLSGVFYVHVDDQGGDLILHDPRFNAVRSTPLELSHHFDPIKLTPQTGDIVIFPSYVYHETEICFSDQPRVLIPFDVYIGK